MDPDDNMNLRVASFACYLDTAKDNMVHRVSTLDNSGKPNSNTPSTIIQPPLSIKFSKPHDHGLSNLRVDSFSYLNTTTIGDRDNSSSNNNFVFEVPGPIQDPTSAFTFSQQDHLDGDGCGEISVFGADEYFKMKLESNQGKKHKQYDPMPPVDLHSVKPSSPSLQSEASSWNSQTALMTNTQRVNHQTKQKRTLGKKIFTGFGCKGPCFAKKSIHVTDGSKPVQTGLERMNHPNHAMDKNVLEESRHSIEVFGSRTTSSKGSDIAANMERKLSMLTWDAIPKGGGKNLPTSTTCDDMASEASSDLFEIENISGSMSHLLTSEPVSSCTMSPTSQYAPSEASIQWSVITASAVDYEPNISNVAPNLVQMNNNVAINTNCKISGGKEVVQRIRPGGLLGCKSQKSVDVAEKAYPRTKNQGLDLSVPLGKSQGRMKINHIDTLHLPVKSYNSHP